MICNVHSSLKTPHKYTETTLENMGFKILIKPKNKQNVFWF